MDRASNVEIDVWLQDAILEYLRFSSFEHTAECMVSERYTLMENGRMTFGDSVAEDTNMNLQDIIRGRFMESFVEGDQDRFLSLWNQHIPKQLRNSLSITLLEFNIRVYMALFHLRDDVISGHNADSDELEFIAKLRMRSLKEYLETENTKLANIPEALPMFALPFITNPETHPSFQHIFKREWLIDLQHQLNDLLSRSLTQIKQPELAIMYRKNLGQSVEGVDRASEAAVFDTANDIFSLTIELLQRLGQVRKDPGMLPTKDYLFEMKRKVEYAGDSLIKAARKVELVAPFLKRRSMLSPIASPHQADESGFPKQLALDQSSTPPYSVQNNASSLGSQLGTSLTADPASEPRDRLVRYNSDRLIIPPLDYKAVKSDLVKWGSSASLEESESSTNCATLLQALRWRLSRTPPGHTRHHVVEVFVECDLLGCEAAGSGVISSPGDESADSVGIVDTLLGCGHPVVREYTVRLMSWLARSAAGRSYLLRHPTLLSQLVDMGQGEEESEQLEAKLSGPSTSNLQTRSLETIAFLSTRKTCQRFLVRSSFAGWCISNLARRLEYQETEGSMQDFGLECIAMILMNICLLPRGRKSVTSLAADSVLNVLINAIHSPNVKVQTCIFGALYSLLGVQIFREHCKTSTLGDTLRQFQELNTNEVRNHRQAQFILELLEDERKVNSESKDSDIDSDQSAPSDEGGESDNEADNNPEPEHDLEEHPSMQRATLEEMDLRFGEEFLRTSYSPNTSQQMPKKGGKEDQTNLRSPSRRPKVEVPEELRSKPKIPRTPPGESSRVRPTTSEYEGKVVESKLDNQLQNLPETFNEIVEDVVGSDPFGREDEDEVDIEAEAFKRKSRVLRTPDTATNQHSIVE